MNSEISHKIHISTIFCPDGDLAIMDYGWVAGPGSAATRPYLKRLTSALFL